MSQLKIFLVAGESSGDYCGGKLIASLRKHYTGKLILKGVGGNYMKKEGCSSIFPMSDIAVMGIAEIIPSIFKIMKLINFTAKKIREFDPDIIVTIDSPGFCFRVVKKLVSLKSKGTKFVHYVSPSVWVYRKERAQEMAKYYDLVLALLPFEPQYYKGTGLRCEYVGHHLIENDWSGNPSNFKKKYSIDKGSKVIGVFVGSRKKEMQEMIHVFNESIDKFLSTQKNANDFMVVYPSVSKEATQLIDRCASHYNFPYRIVELNSYKDKIDMMSAFYMALIKSGTSSLELTFAQVPMVVGHKVHKLTAFIARKIFKVFQNIKYVSLTNIILNKEVIPEFIQEECTFNNLVLGLNSITLEKNRNRQVADYKRAIKKMGLNGECKPSEKAAKKIIELQI